VMRDLRVMRLVAFARRHMQHAESCPRWMVQAAISIPACRCGADEIMNQFRDAFLP